MVQSVELWGKHTLNLNKVFLTLVSYLDCIVRCDGRTSLYTNSIVIRSSFRWYFSIFVLFQINFFFSEYIMLLWSAQLEFIQAIVCKHIRVICRNLDHCRSFESALDCLNGEATLSLSVHTWKHAKNMTHFVISLKICLHFMWNDIADSRIGFIEFCSRHHPCTPWVQSRLSGQWT